MLNVFLLIVLLFFASQVIGSNGLDDSDYNSKNKSGLTVHIDARTGCHYLQSHGIFGFGSSLTPRLDGDGNQIVEHKKLDSE